MQQAPGISSTVAGVTQHRPYWAAAVAFVLLSLAFAVGEGTALATHSSSTIGLLAIDANPEDNAATSLGPLDGCSRVEPGAQINVDYVVDSIPQDRPMIGFELEFRYNEDLVEIVGVDFSLMLAAVGRYQPFSGLTDALPDADGSYRLSVLDTASITGDENTPEANVERGNGVLARFTLRAKAAGVSDLVIGYDPPSRVFPLTQDTQNEAVIADKIGGAALAIGQDCPPERIAPNIIDPPNTEAEFFGGTPPPGGTTVTSAPPTAEGQTPTPEGQTPTPAPTATPCVVTAERTTSASPAPPDASLSPSPSSPPADAQAPESPASTAAATPLTSPAPADVLCTPIPTPLQDEIVDVEENSDTVLIAGAAALLALGTAAGGGGWYLQRRSRNSSPDG